MRLLGRVCWVATFAVSAAASGCAHGRGGAPTSGGLDSPERTGEAVATLRSQNAAYLRQIEELQNQVFILKDQLELRQTAAEPPSAHAGPELPRVRLRPEAPLADDEAAEGDTPRVEYAGEAARSGARRPVLRLVGTGRDAYVDSGETGDERVLREGRRARGPDSRPLSEVPVRRVAGVHRAEAASPRSDGAVAVYQRALDALTAGQHADAAAGFRAFLRQYPQHDRADNAQYWLAECYYDLHDFEAASREFGRVVELYPQGNKAPDALLKLGFSYAALGRGAEARSALERLVAAYPTHPAAARASARLGELASAEPARPRALAGGK